MSNVTCIHVACLAFKNHQIFSMQLWNYLDCANNLAVTTYSTSHLQSTLKHYLINLPSILFSRFG